MTTAQREAAKKNLQQPRDKEENWMPRESSGSRRPQQGAKGGGDYFRIEVRPKDEFRTFRYQDVGKKGHIQRLAGRRRSGAWSTHAWLISKNDAHIEGRKLVPDTQDAKEVIEQLEVKPKQVASDLFEAEGR